MDDQSKLAELDTDVEPRPRSRVLALLLALVPGWGHIYWAREGLGLVFFTLFAPCFFSFTHSYYLYAGDYRDAWVRVSVALLVLIHSGTWIELFLRTRPDRVRAEDELRAQGLKRGMILYVQGDLEGAANAFRQCLHLDPFDIEAQFRLGVVLARRGEAREARRWLRRARKYDVDTKWQWEIEAELKRLRPPQRPAQVPEREVPPRVASREVQGSKAKGCGL